MEDKDIVAVERQLAKAVLVDEDGELMVELFTRTNPDDGFDYRCSLAVSQLLDFDMVIQVMRDTNLQKQMGPRKPDWLKNGC